MRRFFYYGIVSFCVVFSLLLPSLAHSQYLQNLELYRPLDDKSSLEGKLSSRGSTRVEPFMRDWITLFREHYSDVTFDIGAAGSETAPDALLEGTANLAMMSRPITQEELKKFQSVKGYPPIGIRVAMDAVAVHVNRVNPLANLSMPQLDAVFSATRKCGYPEKITHWNMLGEVDKTKINVNLLHKAAGARGFFQDKALCFGDYGKASIDTLVTREDMVASIAKSATAIGFSGLGSVNSNTRVIALSRKQEFPSYIPSRENIVSGNYPLTRYLYIYIDQAPHIPMSKLLREFLLLVLSREGQEIVVNNQAIALPPRAISKELDRLRKYK